MSGGSMDYLYSKVLHCANFPLDTPERIAFAAHLKLVAQALHDIEWVDSGDYGPGDENAAIRACLNPAPPQQIEPLTIYRLRDALVASRIIPPAAVEDPEGYDDGVTLFRIEALYRRIT